MTDLLINLVLMKQIIKSAINYARTASFYSLCTVVVAFDSCSILTLFMMGIIQKHNKIYISYAKTAGFYCAIVITFDMFLTGCIWLEPC